MITFSVLDTRVRLDLKVLPLLLLVWGGITWLGVTWHPGRGLLQGLLIGLVSFILLIFVDFGHAFAHILSARRAGAPMDELVISGDMPRTLYKNNEVAPNIHRMRALGGPVYNMIGLLLSLAIFQIASGHPLAREWMGWSAAGHGLLLVMSLLPLPPVDGGTLFKWTLVANGKTEAQADNLVRRVDWWLGIIVAVAGLALLLMRLWIVGLILLAGAAIVFGIAAGKIH